MREQRWWTWHLGAGLVILVLLGAALFHGLYGFRNIVFELNPADGLKKAINAVLTLGGLGLFGFGAWAAWASFQAARLPL